MSHWTKEWTIESVENNWNAIGCIDPEDVVQCIEDAKLLAYLKKHLGNRDFNDMIMMAEEREDMDRDD